MAREDTSSAPTFKQQELAGWEGKAKTYDDYAGKITLRAVQPLLNAAGIDAGTRLLDVASGRGTSRVLPPRGAQLPWVWISLRRWSSRRRGVSRAPNFTKGMPKHCDSKVIRSMRLSARSGYCTWRSRTRQSPRPFESFGPEGTTRSRCGVHPRSTNSAISC